MRDFPPEISTFYSAPGEKPGPAPDTRTPAALLRWFHPEAVLQTIQEFRAVSMSAPLTGVMQLGALATVGVVAVGAGGADIGIAGGGDGDGPSRDCTGGVVDEGDRAAVAVEVKVLRTVKPVPSGFSLNTVP